MRWASRQVLTSSGRTGLVDFSPSSVSRSGPWTRSSQPKRPSRNQTHASNWRTSMYIDAQQQYSVAQVVTATAVSTNAIDHSQFRRLGIGEPLVVLITVGSLAVTAGSLTIQLQGDTTSAFGAPVVEAPSPALATATLVTGFKYVLPVPADLGFTRWSRLNY